jgi:ATP-dependent helicase/nuclease subunit A
VVRAAAAAAHWREVYVCAPLDGRLLEGYIDLLYRGPDGLVVVDHKTSATADPGELDRRVEGYRNQGAAYALAVHTTTDEPVVEVTFLFLTPQGAIARRLDGLDEAVAHVRHLVATGGDVTLA